MSEKRYPTRMHEVLGVETGERFQIKGQTPWYDENFYVDENGDVRREGWSPPFDRVAVYLINNPERIIRRPRLTEEAQEKEDYIIRLERMRSQKDQWANGKHAHWLEIPADHAKDRDALDAAIEALTGKSRLTEEQVAQLKALVTLLRFYKGGVSI